MRGFEERGSAWWYDGGSGWNVGSGWDSGDKSSVGVLFLRRASSNWIISVSEQTSADINYEGAVGGGEGGSRLIGLGEASRKGVICIER